MGARQLQVLDVVLSTGSLRDDVVNFQDVEGTLAATPVILTLIPAEQNVLVLAVGTGASMSVRLGISVRAVTSRLWYRSPMDCCRRMLTNSTALGEMSTPAQVLSGDARCSAATGGGRPAKKGLAQKNLRQFSRMDAPGRHRAGRVSVAMP